MSCICPIRISRHRGQSIARVDVTLTILAPSGDFRRPFLFDSGCGLTTVSEDVAAAIHLPAGGQLIAVSSAVGTGTGRLVPVSFRFPPDSISGVVGDPVDSMWVVISGRTKLALLGLHEVHLHYTISTDDDTMYFMSR